MHSACSGNPLNKSHKCGNIAYGVNILFYVDVYKRFAYMSGV